MPARNTQARHNDSFSGKILKSWDQKDVDLAMSSQKVRELGRQSEASRTVRRKKVQLDPNELFADIEAMEDSK